MNSKYNHSDVVPDSDRFADAERPSSAVKSTRAFAHIWRAMLHTTHNQLESNSVQHMSAQRARVPNEINYIALLLGKHGNNEHASALIKVSSPVNASDYSRSLMSLFICSALAARVCCEHAAPFRGVRPSNFAP